jgi:hypothetical protein
MRAIAVLLLSQVQELLFTLLFALAPKGEAMGGPSGVAVPTTAALCKLQTKLVVPVYSV